MSFEIGSIPATDAGCMERKKSVSNFPGNGKKGAMKANKPRQRMQWRLLAIATAITTCLKGMRTQERKSAACP